MAEQIKASGAQGDSLCDCWYSYNENPTSRVASGLQGFACVLPFPCVWLWCLFWRSELRLSCFCDRFFINWAIPPTPQAPFSWDGVSEVSVCRSLILLVAAVGMRGTHYHAQHSQPVLIIIQEYSMACTLTNFSSASTHLFHADGGLLTHFYCLV